ncbi:MAG: hypothetical protein KDC71_24520 [Acidobacteria bacterium]|nr:hypothetical protein [Acidobacteriota bacterium]
MLFLMLAFFGDFNCDQVRLAKFGRITNDDTLQLQTIIEQQFQAVHTMLYDQTDDEEQSEDILAALRQLGSSLNAFNEGIVKDIRLQNLGIWNGTALGHDYNLRMVELFRKLNDKDAAIQVLEQDHTVFQNTTKDLETQYRRGVLHQAWDEKTEAIEAFQKVLNNTILQHAYLLDTTCHATVFNTCSALALLHISSDNDAGVLAAYTFMLNYADSVGYFSPMLFDAMFNLNSYAINSKKPTVRRAYDSLMTQYGSTLLAGFDPSLRSDRAAWDATINQQQANFAENTRSFADPTLQLDCLEITSFLENTQDAAP